MENLDQVVSDLRAGCDYRLEFGRLEKSEKEYVVVTPFAKYEYGERITAKLDVDGGYWLHLKKESEEIPSAVRLEQIIGYLEESSKYFA